MILGLRVCAAVCDNVRVCVRCVCIYQCVTQWGSHLSRVAVSCCLHLPCAALHLLWAVPAPPVGSGFPPQEHLHTASPACALSQVPAVLPPACSSPCAAHYSGSCLAGPPAQSHPCCLQAVLGLLLPTWRRWDLQHISQEADYRTNKGRLSRAGFVPWQPPHRSPVPAHSLLRAAVSPPLAHRKCLHLN